MSTDDQQPGADHRRTAPGQLPRTADEHRAQLEKYLADRPYLVELAAHLDAAMREYEQSRPEVRAAGAPGFDERLADLAPSLLALARAHVHRTREERDAHIEAIGSSMSLAEAGTLRRAAKAVERNLPELVLDARIAGYSPAEIARELVVTESYVYRMLREHAWEASYRVDRREAGKWVEVDAGQREVYKSSAEEVAKAVLGEQNVPEGVTVRVYVWRAEDSDDAEPRGGVVINP